MVDRISSYTNYSPSFGNANPGVYRGIQGAVVANSSEIENLSRFMAGEKPAPPEGTITEATVGQLPFMGIFGTIQAFPWLKKHYKNPLETIKNEKAAWLSNPANKRYDLYGNGKEVFLKEKNRIFKGLTDIEKADLQKDRKFLGRMLDHIPGYKKVRASGFGQLMGKSGAGWMIAIDGTLKLFTEIAPTFSQLGAGAGIKQIGKSAAMVASSAAGWTAGAIAGSTVGAAIGTAICPGIGTAIGKFAGDFIGGSIGMWLANKGTKAIVGKSELEKANENQAVNIKKAADQNPEAKLQLAKQAATKAGTILKKDPNNQEALKVLSDAQKVLENAQGGSIDEKADSAEQMYNAVQEELAQTPQFGTMTMPGVPVVPGFNGTGYDMNQYRQSMANASMPNLNNAALKYGANRMPNADYMANPIQ